MLVLGVANSFDTLLLVSTRPKMDKVLEMLRNEQFSINLVVLQRNLEQKIHQDNNLESRRSTGMPACSNRLILDHELHNCP